MSQTRRMGRMRTKRELPNYSHLHSNANSNFSDANANRWAVRSGKKWVENGRKNHVAWVGLPVRRCHG